MVIALKQRKAGFVYFVFFEGECIGGLVCCEDIRIH